MTLLQVIKRMEQVASGQPAVNMIIRNDVFKLNSIADAKYGIFAWVQGQHSGEIVSGQHSFRFSLFYIDRLTSDESNQVEVQSTACEVLHNIIATLDEEGIYADSYSLITFNQRFQDSCSGAFADITFQVPAGSLCSEDFPISNNVIIR